MWYLLLLTKWSKKVTLRFLKDCMQPYGSLLNHLWADPDRVVKKTLHLTPSVYRYSKVAFSKRKRWSLGLEDPLYSPSCRGQKCFGNSSSIMLWENGVPRLFFSVMINGDLPFLGFVWGDFREADSRDCSPCGTDILGNGLVGAWGNLAGFSIRDMCLCRISSTVAVIILVKFSLVKTSPVEPWFSEFPLASPISTSQFRFSQNDTNLILSDIRGWDDSEEYSWTKTFNRLSTNRVNLLWSFTGRSDAGCLREVDAEWLQEVGLCETLRGQALQDFGRSGVVGLWEVGLCETSGGQDSSREIFSQSTSYSGLKELGNRLEGGLRCSSACSLRCSSHKVENKYRNGEK